MKRFLITSPKFTGQAELIYNEDGRLMHVNLVDTDMNAATAQAFVRCVSGDAVNVADRFGADVQIVSADVEITFDMFWKAYGKKINKSRCIILWGKLNKAAQVAAYVGIRKYNKYLFENKWRGKADPETYLRNAYWENEYE